MQRRRIVIVVLFVVAAIFLYLDFGDEGQKRSFKDVFSGKTELSYQKLEGSVFGTFYHITYAHPNNEDLNAAIQKRFNAFNASLSNYDPNSVISRVNKNELFLLSDTLFRTVYNKALEVSKNTNGAFDITVAPLVNYWGFGFTDFDKSKMHINQPAIDSLKAFVGFDKITLVGDSIIKDDPRIQMDVSAIAKGYGVDVIADLLKSKGCENYLVEIGGEVVTRGLNPKGQAWKIGINKPKDSPVPMEEEMQATVAISGKGLASSGNYRQFYELDGKKYSHTIDPLTGFPVEHNLLASSVIADDCMTADAYATACMVLGVQKSMDLINSLPGIEVYLIYQNQSGELSVVYTNGFKPYLVE